MVHSRSRFSFEMANLVMAPFFHNHVLYSTTIAVFLPFVWFARFWYPGGSFLRMVLNAGLLVLLFSVTVAYTRASWLAVMALIPCFLIVKYRLTKAGLVVAGIALTITVIYLVRQNQYLEYAIEYRKVIFHEGDLEKHLEATYQFEDVSGMERVYRWVAAKKMVEDHWFLGSGPSTFYPEYKRYTVNAFTTFVSDNPERSTTHNYFLMVLTEQGVIGFLLFTGLYVYLVLRGTRLYTSLRNRNYKNLAMATTLSLFMLALHLFLNDLIETDKVGALFYLSCIFLVKLDQWQKEEELQNAQESLQEK
jgi:O-antigen ligase